MQNTLSQRVISLSMDTIPVRFPEESAHESMEISLQRKVEMMFQHALHKRIWLQLSPEERAQVRAMILAERKKNNRSIHTDLEWDCLGVIEKILTKRKRK